jgi:Fic family protein
MNTKLVAWQPRYTLTPAVARSLMEIEAARAVVDRTPLSPSVKNELRRRARIRSTHYSTRIEGNRLTLAEAEQVIEGQKTQFHGRERDVREIRNYWNALLRVEEWAARKASMNEDLIRRLHALVEKGPRAKPTPYRDGQNVIRDSASGRVIYLPPEATDVPALMTAMVAWVNQAEKNEVPVPLIAALIHYQFVTIHPYYDGNGRTARLLATFILHRGGYGLGGFFSLEEHHARDLDAYYGSLAVHAQHNYYDGRAEADLTVWLEYFMTTLSEVFTSAREEALHLAIEGVPSEPEELRRLDHRARVVLALFDQANQITTAQVAEALGLSPRMARVLLRDWVNAGWLEVVEASNRNRTYGLSATYRQYIGNASAKVGHRSNRSTSR